MKAGVGFVRDAVEFVEHFLDRVGIHIAHQLTDVLHLTAKCAMGVDLLGFQHRIQKRFGDVQFLQPVVANTHQAFAQILQSLHFFLGFGLAATPAFGQRRWFGVDDHLPLAGMKVAGWFAGMKWHDRFGDVAVCRYHTNRKTIPVARPGQS